MIYSRLASIFRPKVGFKQVFHFSRFSGDVARLKRFFAAFLAVQLVYAAAVWAADGEPGDVAESPGVESAAKPESPAEIPVADPGIQKVIEGSGDAETERDNMRGLSGSYLAMKFARSQGDKYSAVNYLEKALRKDPKNDTLAGQLMVLHLLSGEMNQAVKLAHGLSENPNRELITDMLLAIQQVKKGEFGKSSETLKAAFESGFGTLWLPLVSAWLEYGQGKVDKPLELKDIAPKVGKVAPLIYYHIGLINSMAGFKEQGLADLEKAAADQDNIPFRVMEALAYHYRQNGDDKKLDALLAKFRKAHPELAFTADARDFLGVKPVVASVQDGVAEVLFTMASILFTAEAGQDTMLYLRMALYLQPDFPAAQMILANMLEADEDYADANIVYASISEESPFYGRARLRSALNLDRQKKYQEAIAALDALIDMNDQRYEVMIAKGDVLRGRDRYAEAVQAYTQALEILPKEATIGWAVLFARGACYERMGDWPSAQKDLQTALELSPDQPEVLNYLGYTWLVRGERVAEAKNLLEKAISLRPNDAHIIDSMGWALYNLGDYEQGIVYLERAIELMPSDPTVNEHLGDAYWQAGRKSEARFQWERVLVYSPDPVQEEAIRRKLEAGLPTTGVPVPATAKQDIPSDTTTQ